MNRMDCKSIGCMLIMAMAISAGPFVGAQAASSGEVAWNKVSVQNISASPSALHFAWASETEFFVDGKKVLDAVKMGPASLAWSPDSKCVGIWAYKDEKWTFYLYNLNTHVLDARMSSPCLMVEGIMENRPTTIYIPFNMTIRLRNGAQWTGGNETEAVSFEAPASWLWAIHKKDQPLTPAADRSILLSVDGTHWLWSTLTESGDSVFRQFQRDGKAIGSPWKSEQGPWEPHVSSDGSLLGYVRETEGKYFFVQWSAASGEQWEGPWDTIGRPTFSTDLKHHAYQAKVGPDVFLVVDGVKTATASEDVDLVALGPDGRLAAWVTKKKDKCHVENPSSAPSEGYDRIGFLSAAPTGHDIVYSAQTGGKWVVVDDGKAGQPFHSVGCPIFSSEGKHFAYRAEGENGSQMVVVDGVPGEPFDSVLGAPVFTLKNTIRYMVLEKSTGKTKRIESALGKTGL